MGKGRHYSQQALKYQQQSHQVSVPVTNNVTTFPIKSFRCLISKKPFLPNAKTNPYTLQIEITLKPDVIQTR